MLFPSTETVELKTAKMTENWIATVSKIYF